MKFKVFGFIAIISSIFSTTTLADTIKVTASQPVAGAIVSNGILHVTAAASALNGTLIEPITGWVVYIGSKGFDLQTAAASVNKDIDVSSIADGVYPITIKAWDSRGFVGQDVISGISIRKTQGTGFDGSTIIPNPPSTANHITQIDSLRSWSFCTGACSQCPNGISCPGVITANGDPIVEEVTEPAGLSVGDGIAALFQVFNGPSWATALWGHSIANLPAANNFIWDFYVYVSSTNYNSSEFDFYKALTGQRYMMGSQCNRGAGVWDGWDEGASHWVHTTVPCNATTFAAAKWHHVTWYLSTNSTSHTYTYHTLRVDEVDHPVNLTEPSKASTWASGVVGLQVQLDANLSGAGVKEYVDKMQAYAW